MAQQIIGTLIQEGTSQTRPPKFTRKHFFTLESVNRNLQKIL